MDEGAMCRSQGIVAINLAEEMALHRGQEKGVHIFPINWDTNLVVFWN